MTFGSYSYAKPKGSKSRKTLGQVLEEKIYFAGEACSVKPFWNYPWRVFFRHSFSKENPQFHMSDLST